jgi:hypothetical protein
MAKRLAIPGVCTALLLLLATPRTDAQSPKPATAGQSPRLNQIQVLGSHNSYKQAIEPELLRILLQKDAPRFEALEYSHLPFAEQLDRGIRQLEIDVVHDPRGGRYAKPHGLQVLKQRGLPALPYDPEGFLLKPGLKVLHVPDVDFRTHAYTFRQALEQLKAWSDAHSSHLPIVILMNAKDAPVDEPHFTKLLPFDAAAFDAWDAEILAVLPRGRLITPDDVRGAYDTLEKAALAQAWPTLDESRGRFLFILDEHDHKREIYVAGHPSLRGRVMFADAAPGTAEAAFCIVNEVGTDLARIQQLVRSGYLVRTRADADTREARSGDYSRAKAAFASGAQFVSTDYYLPAPFPSRFQVSLPGGGTARANPVVSPGLELPTPLE